MNSRSFSRPASLGLALCVSAVACASSPEAPGPRVTGAGGGGAGGVSSGFGGAPAATAAASTSTGGTGGGSTSTTQAAVDAGTGLGGGSTGGGGSSSCAPPPAKSAPSGPAVCGDSFRDPGSEECDDGAGNGIGACDAACSVVDLVLAPPPADAGAALDMTLGGQPHPVAIGAWGFAAGVRSSSGELDIAFFDDLGRSVAIRPVSAGSSLYPSGTGVALAALDCGRYAAAWTDYGDDGDAAGVALRLIDPSSPVAGPPGHANAVTDFDQVLEDMTWTGSELVVAWFDDGDLSGAGDLKVRTFDGTLSPTSPDRVLAHTSGLSTSAVLSPFAGSWAAAWLSYQDGSVSILAGAGDVSWSAGTLGAGATVDRPALVDLDATHLLVVYAASTSVGEPATLQGAILDTAAPGSAVPFTIPSSGGAVGASAREPRAARVGARVFLSWVSSGDPSSTPAGPGNVWLKEIDLGAAPGEIDLSQPEIPLPRAAADATGAQAAPVLARALSGTPGALVAAWEDHGVPGSPRTLVEMAPVPLLRKVGQ